MHLRHLFVCPTHVRFHRLLRLISSYIFYNKIHDRKFTTKKIQQKIKILKLHPGINNTLILQPLKRKLKPIVPYN